MKFLHLLPMVNFSSNKQHSLMNLKPPLLEPSKTDLARLGLSIVIEQVCGMEGEVSGPQKDAMISNESA